MSTTRKPTGKRPLLPDDDPARPKRARTADPDASLSDDDMDLDLDSPTTDDALEDDHDNADSDADTPPRRAAPKARPGATKGRAGRTGHAQHKGTKAKGPDREILIKDERRPAATSRASSATAQSQPSDLFSNEEPSTLDPIADPAKDPLSQAIPKKRKLPPIKKTKTTTSATSTVTPTATVQKPPPPVQELAKPLLPTSEQRKQALTGVRDIDLADSKVYAELFKGAGGITPRSGLKNAEERRRELDKMRDEARARRVEEGKCTFDLQSQADKIARFEQRLRAENSTVLHPNFLAAKFRDEWELERRNRRATSKEEGEA